MHFIEKKRISSNKPVKFDTALPNSTEISAFYCFKTEFFSHKTSKIVGFDLQEPKNDLGVGHFGKKSRSSFLFPE
jgi:hypothetical protein